MRRLLAGWERPALVLGLAVAAALATAAEDETTGAAPIELRGGKVRFEVGTNVPALGVAGQSGALTGRARLRQEGSQVRLQALEAAVPVRSLNTGIGQRDEHMRRYVFTTGDGELPDLRFVADEAACPVPEAGESSCTIAGQLSLRGVTRPFALTLKVRPERGGYKAGGDGLLKLSDWGIERPSQLGVRTDDEVKLHLEFKVAPALRADAR
jgi:polyisoprenoid-binding protein YceI